MKVESSHLRKTFCWTPPGRQAPLIRGSSGGAGWWRWGLNPGPGMPFQCHWCRHSCERNINLLSSWLFFIAEPWIMEMLIVWWRYVLSSGFWSSIYRKDPLCKGYISFCWNNRGGGPSGEEGWSSSTGTMAMAALCYWGGLGITAGFQNASFLKMGALFTVQSCQVNSSIYSISILILFLPH